MTIVFLICAALGGTTLIMQFLLTLIGLGGHSLDCGAPHDLGHDFGGLAHDHDVGAPHNDTVSLFGIISFRTVVAALAFFGLAGLAAESGGASPPLSLAIALASGFGAMYSVYRIMCLIQGLRSEGTAKIQRALGLSASVYLAIPANNAGDGKIQINIQNRTMEYLARTCGERIPTGAKVTVTGILTNDTVEVLRLEDLERN